MKNKFIIVLMLFIGACGVKGVKDTTDKNTSPDLYVNDTLVDTTKQNDDIDTGFAFTKKLPTDSITLKNGVKIVFLTHGKGEKIKKFDVVALNYRGMLTNKKIIESNENLKQPIPFVIGLELTFDAFDQALLECVEGDNIRFTIPAKLAYGEKGRGEVVPPNSDLIYEVAILEKIQGQKTPSGVEIFSLIKHENNIKAENGDLIELAYKGWIKKNGKLFDASAASGKLYEFDLGTGTVIKAWHETVATMRKGEKVLIIAPSATCYGNKGVPELVPPNSDLVYILELNAITKKAK